MPIELKLLLLPILPLLREESVRPNELAQRNEGIAVSGNLSGPPDSSVGGGQPPVL